MSLLDNFFWKGVVIFHWLLILISKNYNGTEVYIKLKEEAVVAKHSLF